MKGYIQIYTGDGKGKTTAAIGLAVRAAGAGLKVFIGQFLKGGEYSELAALRRLSSQIEIHQYGTGIFIRGEPSPEDRAAAARGVAEVREVIRRGDHDLVILDEVNVALRLGLFPLAELQAAIAEKPAEMELVLTGRGAPPELLERADLVTEMKEIKHYYARGVQARKGIEK